MARSRVARARDVVGLAKHRSEAERRDGPVLRVAGIGSNAQGDLCSDSVTGIGQVEAQAERSVRGSIRVAGFDSPLVVSSRRIELAPAC